MRNMLLNFNPNTLETMANALESYHGVIGNRLGQYCYDMNTQPRATAELLRQSADYQGLLNEVKQINLIKKQIEYQRRLRKNGK